MYFRSLILASLLAIVGADYEITILYPREGSYTLMGSALSGAPGFSISCLGNCSSSTSMYYHTSDATGFYLSGSSSFASVTTYSGTVFSLATVLAESQCSYISVGGAVCQVTSEILFLNSGMDSNSGYYVSTQTTTTSINALALAKVPVTFTGVTATSPPPVSTPSSSGIPLITGTGGVKGPITLGEFVATLLIPQVGNYALQMISTKIGTNTAYVVSCTGQCNQIGTSFTYIVSDSTAFEMLETLTDSNLIIPYASSTYYTATITNTQICTYPTPGDGLFRSQEQTTVGGDGVTLSTIAFPYSIPENELHFYIAPIHAGCPTGGCLSYRKLTNAQIAGIVAGGLAFIGTIVLVVSCLWLRRRKRLSSRSSSTNEPGADDTEKIPVPAPDSSRFRAIAVSFRRRDIRHELEGDYDAPAELHVSPNPPRIPAESEFGSKKPWMPGFLSRNTSIHAPIPLHTEYTELPSTSASPTRANSKPAESTSSPTLTANSSAPPHSPEISPEAGAALQVGGREQLQQEYQEVQQRRERLQELMRLEQEEARLRREMGQGQKVNEPVELDSQTFIGRKE
jgi:hypothetical protein